VANAAVYECCSGSQAQNISLNLAVNYGAQDASFSGGVGSYRMPQVGDLVVVFAGVDNTAGTPQSISDSKANTWTAIQTQAGAVNQQFKCWGSVIAAGKVPTSSDTITVAFAATSGSKHLIAKVIVGPSAVTAFNQVTTQGSGGGTWSSGASGAITPTKIQIGVLQNASAGGKPTALTFDAAGATFTQAPSGHWSAFMVDTNPPAGGQAAGGTTASGTWAAGTWTHTAPTPATGTGTIASKKIALAGSGTYIDPTTGSGAIASKKIALAGSGSYIPPTTGTGGIASKKVALAGSGTYTPPTTGTGTITAKKVALAGVGTYTPPPVTGTGAIAAKKVALAGSGTYTPPITGTGAVASKKIALAGLGSYAGAVVGTGAIASKKVALAGVGTYTPPPVTGTGAVKAKKIALAGTGTAGIQGTTGFGGITAKKISLAGLGTYTDPAPVVPVPVVLAEGPPALVPVVWGQLSLNDGNRDDGLCTVVTDVSGWYGSPPLDGNDLARVLADGALYGYKTLGPRLVTISGAAAGPRDLLNNYARQLAGLAAGRQAVSLLVGEDDGSDDPGSLAAMARADSDSLTLAWQGRELFTWQVALTLADPRLYEGEVRTVTLTPLPSGAPTGRTYPFAPPRFYASADVANAAILTNVGNAPAPVFITYTGSLAESRLTDGQTTIHLAPVGAGQQIYVNSETLAASAPGGASRASYLLPGTAPLLVPPYSDTPWYLYGTGSGTVTLAWQGAWT